MNLYKNIVPQYVYVNGMMISKKKKEKIWKQSKLQLIVMEIKLFAYTKPKQNEKKNDVDGISRGKH